ncbi:MAG: hypothetical protein ACLR17_00440 [Enterobacteriaceae bacterium]
MDAVRDNIVRIYSAMCLVASLLRFSWNCTALTQLRRACSATAWKLRISAGHSVDARNCCACEFFKDLPWPTILEPFSGCSLPVKAGKAVFSGCALAQTFSSAFYYCRVLEDGMMVLRGVSVQLPLPASSILHSINGATVVCGL